MPNPLLFVSTVRVCSEGVVLTTCMLSGLLRPEIEPDKKGETECEKAHWSPAIILWSCTPDVVGVLLMGISGCSHQETMLSN